MSFRKDVMFLHTLTEKDIAEFITNNCKDPVNIKSVVSIAALPPSENHNTNARTVYYIRFIDGSDRKAKYFRFVINKGNQMKTYSNPVVLSAEKAYIDFEDHVYYANGKIMPRRNAIKLFICWGSPTDKGYR